MKNLLMVLLLTPLAVFAQEAPQQVPTPQQLTMMEYSQATVMQTVCFVYYERTNQDEKGTIYAAAPFVHADQHGIPADFVLEMVAELLPGIRANFDTLTEENEGKILAMCDDTYENIRVVVEAWMERQAPQQHHETEPENETEIEYIIPGAIVV